MTEDKIKARLNCDICGRGNFTDKRSLSSHRRWHNPKNIKPNRAGENNPNWRGGKEKARERHIKYHKEYVKTKHYPNNRQKYLENSRRYYQDNLERVKNRNRNNYRKNCLREGLKKRIYRKNNKIKLRELGRKIYSKNKEVFIIRSKTKQRFKDSKVMCERCKSTKDLEFHHPKPYRVEVFIVLCKSCHFKEHGKSKVLYHG